MKSYYDILGVDQEAGTDKIKKAFRDRAKGCHPDHHPGDKAREAEFKELSIAYGVLSDPASRKHYDEHGEAPPPENILAEAYKCIIKAFMAVREDEGDGIFYRDPFLRIREAINDGRKEAQAEIRKAEAANKKNRKLMEKIVHKTGGGRSFLHTSLAGEIRKGEAEIASIERAIVIMDKSLAVLDEFTFETEKRKDGDVRDLRREFPPFTMDAEALYRAFNPFPGGFTWKPSS